MLIKLHYIIISCNKILKTTLEVKILLQHLYDMLQLAISFWKVYSATQHTDFAKAFCTHKMSFSFILHTCMSFHLCPKEKWSLSRFSKTCNCQTLLCALTLCQLLPKLDSRHGCTDRKTFKPLSEGFHLMQLSFTEFLWTNFHSNPEVKYGFHCADFYKTHICSGALRGVLVH